MPVRGPSAPEPCWDAPTSLRDKEVIPSETGNPDSEGITLLGPDHYPEYVVPTVAMPTTGWFSLMPPAEPKNLASP
jgi:hypothetical protein